MYKVYKNVKMTDEGFLFGIENEAASKSCSPGQFFEVTYKKELPKVPVIIADILPERGVVKVVFRPVNETTVAMTKLDNGDYIEDLTGPFGNPCPFYKDDLSGKTVLVVAEDLAGAAAYLMIHDIGKKCAAIDAVAGGKTKGCLYLSEFTGELCRKYINLSDDGTQGEKGTIVDRIGDILDSEKYDLAVVLGFADTAETICREALNRGIKTYVSFDPAITNKQGYKTVNHVVVDGVESCLKETGTMYDASKVDFGDIKAQLK